jgi:uncharacterized protein with GYD domain
LRLYTFSVAQYILLLTLDSGGRHKMVEDAHSLVRAAEAVEDETEGASFLGFYGVLGQYDFVCILDAPDNEAAARFSLALGARAGASVETLPAVPIALLERERRREPTQPPPEVGRPLGPREPARP